MVKAVAMMVAVLALDKGMPLNCDHICAAHYKAKELSPQDTAANYWMTMNQGVLNGFLQKDKKEPIDMGVTAAQCACMGITKIGASGDTGRDLTGDAELDGRLLECDKTEADCKKCCMGEAAYRGKCSADQGEEACSQSCEMAHSECETAARQWESR